MSEKENKDLEKELNSSQDIHEENSLENNTQNVSANCEECKKKLEKLIYLTADFENYRRNIMKERALWNEASKAEVLKTVLPIIDNFERALNEIKKPEATASETGFSKKNMDGLNLIYQSMLKILKTHEVEEIAADTFDPKFHEAVMQIESADKESGEIVEILEKGYKQSSIVLRPAKVIVAK